MLGGSIFNGTVRSGAVIILLLVGGLVSRGR